MYHSVLFVDLNVSTSTVIDLSLHNDLLKKKA